MAVELAAYERRSEKDPPRKTVTASRRTRVMRVREANCASCAVTASRTLLLRTPRLQSICMMRLDGV